MRRMISPWAAAFALTIAPAATAFAQQTPDFTIEELMRENVERVFGASRRLQSVTDAPSSVTIVTAEEIERMGYQSLAELLRGVRGFYVSYDRNYSYLGARGFALPGDYNTRVLLLIDGHRLNDNIYDQAAIGPELGLDLSTFERVEIIRGPSSSLYGTSAFFAVINMISKTGAAVDGVRAEVQTGSFYSNRGSVIAGRRLANGVDFAVSGSFERSEGPETLYFPTFDSAETNRGVAVGLDDEQMARAGGHVSLGSLTLRAGYSNREKGIPTASYGTLFNDSRFRTTDSRAFVDLQYHREVRDTRVDVRTYSDYYDYSGVYPFAPEGEPNSLYRDYATGAWWGVDGRISRPLAWRQTMTLGGEYRRNFKQAQGGDYLDEITPMLFIRATSQTTGAYVEDEIALGKYLLVSGGLRYDHYTGFSRVTPRSAVIFKPTPSRAIKYLFGRAFRAPNAYELDYYQPRQGPLQAESIATHELIWEEYAGSWLRTSVSGYFNRVSDLVRLDANSPEELFFVNQGKVDAEGVELEAEVKTRGGLHALASYALQNAEDSELRERLTNSPRHVLKGRVMVPLPRPGSSVAVDIERMSPRETLSGAQVPSATLVGMNVIQPMSRSMAVTFRVRNAFNLRYSDPGSEEHLQDAIAQNGRTFSVGLRWRFQ